MKCSYCEGKRHLRFFILIVFKQECYIFLKLDNQSIHMDFIEYRFYNARYV